MKPHLKSPPQLQEDPDTPNRKNRREQKETTQTEITDQANKGDETKTQRRSCTTGREFQTPWKRTVPHEGYFVPSSPVRISHAHSLDTRGRPDRRRIQRHITPR